MNVFVMQKMKIVLSWSGSSYLVLLVFCYFPLFVLFVSTSHLFAMTQPLPPADVDLIGYTGITQARSEDTLLDIARRYNLGQNEIMLANPDVDRWLPGEDTYVVLPSRFILPRSERKGIVLNLPEMRLYYFFNTGPEKTPQVTTHPVSIGRMDWNTPLGETRVETKHKDPSWRPPESLKLEAAAEGNPLPDVIPPGPDNPLGRYALRLRIPGYLIHSTNKPFGVGMRVTHGCVRMYPEDIEKLFPIVPIHTTVRIVNQPIKLGWKGKTLYLEVHPQIDEDLLGNEDITCMAYKMILTEIEDRDAILDIKTIRRALLEKNGMPVPITIVVDAFEL